MATVFPTTGAARAAYDGDTSFLRSTWSVCTRPNLVAVRSRYSTRSCEYHGGDGSRSYDIVTGVQGNVVIAFVVVVGNEGAGSLAQVQDDASTVARAALAAYRTLPVRFAQPTPRPTPQPANNVHVCTYDHTALDAEYVRYCVSDAAVVSDLSAAVLVTQPGDSLGGTVTISIARVGGRRLGQVTGDELLGCVSLYEVFSMTGVTAVPGTTYRVTASDDGDFLGSATFTYQP